MDIEDIIDEFDNYIDEKYGVLHILNRQYKVSDLLKDIAHADYCKELDSYIEMKQYKVIR